MILTADIAAIFSTGKGALITAWRRALVSLSKTFNRYYIYICNTAYVYIYI